MRTEWAGPSSRLLFVCTGNVCRSPLAERVLAAGLRRRDVRGVAVTSAGTSAPPGRPMSERTAQLVLLHGGDPAGHRARAVDRDTIRDADVVLTMTRAHRAAVVGMDPGALHRTFTLGESARLLARISPAAAAGLPRSPGPRLPALAALLSATRRAGPPPLLAEDDIIDPLGGDDAVHLASAEQIAPAVAAWLDALALALPPVRSDPSPCAVATGRLGETRGSAW